MASTPGHATVKRPAAAVRHAHAFNGTRTVGALFLGTNPGGLHSCTASVVRSSTRNVIVTAAHCLGSGGGQGYGFAPAFHNGKTPYGVWRTTAAYASPRWIKHDGDQRRDFVFLTVATKVIDGQRRRLQDVVGGNRLGFAATEGEPISIIGYPVGVGGRPIMCATAAELRHGYVRSDCHGFADGTSGGPWLAGSGRTRTLVGLVGGFNQGGCTPKRVWSSPLGKPARLALERAEHHSHPDSMPLRPSDGCKSGQ